MRSNYDYQDDPMMPKSGIALTIAQVTRLRFAARSCGSMMPFEWRLDELSET